MRLPIEYFKGIEFVRISSLTHDQQKQVWASFDQEKIIKIVRERSLLNDCILYSDFQAWQSRTSAIKAIPSLNRKEQVNPPLGKLAFD